MLSRTLVTSLFAALALPFLAAAQPPPPNDLCTAATPIPGPFIAVAGTNVNAGTEGETTCTPSSRDVYFSFVPSVTASHAITLNRSSPVWNNVVSVHTGCPATIANQVAGGCNDDSEDVRPKICDVTLNAGQSYRIRVAGFGLTGVNANSFTVFIGSGDRGACCTSAGVCVLVGSISVCCKSPPHSYTVPGVTACIPNPCKGACCFPTLVCIETTPVGCAVMGGDFLGFGTVCTPETCSPGACCIGATCIVTSQSACDGIFIGVGVPCNVPGNTTTPCCFADVNQSGGVTVQDIFDFLSAFFSGDPLADINGSGDLSVQDLFDFLAAYFTACP